MTRAWMWVALSASMAAFAQQAQKDSAPRPNVMVVAVSRNDSLLTGGIGLGRETKPGTADVEPVAWLTTSGEWMSTGCDGTNQKGCPNFEKNYLKKPHEYAVVSADGNGASVHAAPVTLDECNDYTGTGTYSGASILGSAIAATSPGLFAESKPPQILSGPAAAPIRKSLRRLVPRTLDSTARLQVFSLRLEGQEYFVLQRSYSDFADLPGDQPYAYVFAIGTIGPGGFHLIHWKRDKEDEEERILGTVRLKSGSEYLITTASDPESQLFRIYGIRNGKLTLIFAGGGASC